jgi:dsDNA-specific endonuclease/ATPase MutS2
MTDDPTEPINKTDSRCKTRDELAPGDFESDGRTSAEFAGITADPIRLPITDVFDLHSVSPKDAEAVVEEYMHECYRLDLTEIRIIHGRGIGVRRAMVRKVLQRTKFVVSYGDAPLEAGGWGATIVTLCKRGSE